MRRGALGETVAKGDEAIIPRVDGSTSGSKRIARSNDSCMARQP